MRGLRVFDPAATKQRWRALRRPGLPGTPQSPDSPVGFLESRRGIRSIRYESDRSGANFSASSAIDRPTFSAMLLGIDRRTGP